MYKLFWVEARLTSMYGFLVDEIEQYIYGYYHSVNDAEKVYEKIAHYYSDSAFYIQEVIPEIVNKELINYNLN